MEDIKKKSPGRIPMAADKRQGIIDALRENPNATQVAKQLGDVSPTTVWKIAKAAGIEIAKRITITSEKRSEIIAALQENPNANQIARQVDGISTVGVWKIAKKAGIMLTAPDARLKIPEAKRDAIIAALRENPNAAQVAKQVGGISTVGVWKIAKKTGIELSKPGNRKKAKPVAKTVKDSFAPG